VDGRYGSRPLNAARARPFRVDPVGVNIAPLGKSAVGALDGLRLQALREPAPTFTPVGLLIRAVAYQLQVKAREAASAVLETTI
jgi:hypothetical protein